MVQLSEPRIERIADLLTLEGAGRGVDGKFSHDLGHIEGALLALEDFVVLDEVLGLFGDNGNVRAEGLLCKTELDELGLMLAGS